MFYFIKMVTGETIAAIIVMFEFGFADHIWEDAINFESLALNNFLTLAILYAYTHFINSRDDLSDKRRCSSIKLICLLSGLALTNQHQSVLIVMPILAEIWWHDMTTTGTSQLATIAAYTCAPLFLYIQLLVSANLSNTHWKWGHCDTVPGWLRHILQMDYGASIFANDNFYTDAKHSITGY